MKSIKWLYVILLCLIISGCGPHFLGKPDPYVEPAPPVSVDMAKPAPQNITLTMPNWPVYAYAVDEAILVLMVKDPKTFPVPAGIRFTKEDGSIIEMKMVKTEKTK